MLVYQDRVKETSTTTGTGTLTLAGAVTGYRTFTSALANATPVSYCIEMGSEWEVGEGVFTTSGTTLSRVTVIASSNSGALVNFSAGTKNVFLTRSARDTLPFEFITNGLWGSSGCLAATYPRYLIESLVLSAPASGTLTLWGILLPRGLPVTNISFWSGSTALATGSNQWFGLFDSDRNVLAKTADDTNTAWAANTKKTLAVASGPFITTYAGWHYVGILIVASTLPTIVGHGGGGVGGTPRSVAPIIGGTSTTGLTNPASCTGQQTAITAQARLAYAELS